MPGHDGCWQQVRCETCGACLVAEGSQVSQVGVLTQRILQQLQQQVREGRLLRALQQRWGCKCKVRSRLRLANVYSLMAQKLMLLCTGTWQVAFQPLQERCWQAAAVALDHLAVQHDGAASAAPWAGG